MDPIAVKAKTKYAEPKPLKPKDGKTDFQKELESSPYAHALATPIRVCALTSAHLPSHFLLPLVSHIDQPPPNEDINAKPQRVQTHLTPDLGLEVPRLLRSPARSYVLAQHDILTYASTKARWTTLITERMKKWLGRKTGRQWHNFKEKQEWKWDAETAEKVLEKLRVDVAGKLEGAWRRKQLVAVQGAEDMEATVERGGIGCYLKFGNGSEDREADGAALKHAFGIEMGHGVPVYDLARLLGKEHFSKAVEGTIGPELESEAWMMLLRSAHTVELQLSLLKLDAYIRSPRT